MKELLRYWETDYDWRKAEAKLNALPQFVTTIDGVDIQFVHVRSRHPNAMPLIMTHGWPGSIFELIKALVLRPIPRPMVDARRTPSISFCPRCLDMASRQSRSSRVGLPITSHALGPN
jgi:Epoxide hydrolase N terminus